MIYQNDKRLSERMQKWGCFIRSCLIIAERIAGKELTDIQINLIEAEALKAGYIDDKTYTVKSSAPIIRLAFDYLTGKPAKVIEIATSVNGKVTFYPSVKDQYKRVDAQIRKYKQGGPSKTHFVAQLDGETIDPHDPAIRDLGEIYAICYYIEELKNV